MSEWIKCSDKLPEHYKPVTCRLRHCGSGRIVEAELVHVDEDDCSWRTTDDNSEISYSWDVIEWCDQNHLSATETDIQPARVAPTENGLRGWRIANT